jgi:hypothetical protein
MQLNPLYLLVECWSRSAQRARDKRDLEKENYRHKATEAWYARLPPVRSTDETRPEYENVCAQPDSLFFRKLPLEIRRLIYAELFCGKELLFQVPDENRDTFGDELGKEEVPFNLTCPAARGLTAFPMSCKRAYVHIRFGRRRVMTNMDRYMEAIEDVYKCNTFRLGTVTAFWCFRRLVSDQLFELIQDLHLQYPYRQGHDYVKGLRLGIPPYNQTCWKQTWLEICAIRCLKHVKVDLFVITMAMHDGHEDVFFTPLKGLRNDIEVDLRVSWQMNPPVGEDVWPFEVKRDAKYCEEIGGSFRLDERLEK